MAAFCKHMQYASHLLQVQSEANRRQAAMLIFTCILVICPFWWKIFRCNLKLFHEAKILLNTGQQALATNFKINILKLRLNMINVGKKSLHRKMVLSISNDYISG